MSELTLSNPSVFNSLTPYTRALLKLERSMDYSIDVASLKLDMILERKDLELKEAGLKVLVEDGSEDMMDSLYMEAEEKAAGGVLDALKKICDAIIKFFKDSAAMIADKVRAVLAKFSAKHVSPEDWKNSDAYEIAISYDYNKKMAEIEAKMTEGDKLIRECSKRTEIPEGKIKGYVDSVNSLIANIPKLTMKAVKTGAAVGGTVILFKNWKVVAGAMAKTLDKGASIISSIKSKVGKHPKEEKEVLNSVSSLSKEYNKIASRISLGLCAIVNPSKTANDAVKTAAMKGKLGFGTKTMGDVWSAGKRMKEATMRRKS